MTQLDLLLPFGLPPPEMAADLLRALNAPALAALIARAKAPQRCSFDDFSHSLPHEIWIAEQFGLTADLAATGSPSIAVAALRALGHSVEDGLWFMLNPVHIHFARDHLVLTDRRHLSLSDADSRALFEAAKPYFDEVGKRLLYGDAQSWFVAADDWNGFKTSTPDAACGHNIDIWMPHGERERDWRKLQNEVQMLWHTHPVNEAREAQGLKTVNSLWLWGKGMGAASTHASSTIQNPYDQAANLPDWMRAFGPLVEQAHQHYAASDVLSMAAQLGGKTLLVLDQLIGAALATDWSEWLLQMHALEQEWFSPVLQALKAGQIGQINLILSHETAVSCFSTSRNLQRQFWIKPTLKQLQP
ncbi:MAG: hypothetical protein V4805_10080 [Pseudomonadota bacterium]